MSIQIVTAPPRVRASRRQAALLAVALATVLATSRAGAQGAAPPPTTDSLGPAYHLAGRALVALQASSARYDGGGSRTSHVAGAFLPFIGERLQLGVSPSYDRQSGEYDTFKRYSTAFTANYLFGGGARWRGYVGGFGAAYDATRSSGWLEAGAQVGALRFLDPSVALRTELSFSTPTSGSGDGVTTALLFVALDPYLSTGPDATGPMAAGFGVVDVDAFAYVGRTEGRYQSGIAGTVGPYLARWAQVGVEGQAATSSSGSSLYRVRGFGRAYLPLTLRAQPFVEGFAETSNFTGQSDGRSTHGGALGLRWMLAPRIALDVGVRRTLTSRQTLGSGEYQVVYRPPGTTGLVAGIVTRLGRAR